MRHTCDIGNRASWDTCLQCRIERNEMSDQREYAGELDHPQYGEWAYRKERDRENREQYKREHKRVTW